MAKKKRQTRGALKSEVGAALTHGSGSAPDAWEARCGYDGMLWSHFCTHIEPSLPDGFCRSGSCLP